ncbi:IS630 transposase-related protein [Microcoleus sp. AT9_B5]
MKAYCIDLRAKIVKVYSQGNTSIRKVAMRFGVAKSFVQKLLSLQKTQGHVKPKQQGGAIKGEFDDHEVQLAEMVEKYPEATLSEYCEYWGSNYNQRVSTSTMCRQLQKQKLTRKKKTLRSSQGTTEKIQIFRTEYWQKVQKIAAEKLIFIDEMVVLLGLTRTHARNFCGMRVDDFKPFYRGAKVTVIGAISWTKILAVMTLNGSMDGNVFKVFVEKCLLPELWRACCSCHG